MTSYCIAQYRLLDNRTPGEDILVKFYSKWKSLFTKFNLKGRLSYCSGLIFNVIVRDFISPYFHWICLFISFIHPGTIYMCSLCHTETTGYCSEKGKSTTVYSGTDQIKSQSSASLAFVPGIHRWPVNSTQKWPVTWKMFPFDDVIMTTHWPWSIYGNVAGG